jgi:membrane-associated protease RseP (regulator of RpoE activity)
LISGLILSSPLIFNPFYDQSNGLIVQDFIEDGPSYGVIPRFATIFDINSTSIQTQEDLTNYLNLVKPGDTLIINTNLGNYSVITGAHPSNTSRGYLGVFTVDGISYSPRAWIPWADPTFPYYFAMTLEWIWFISFNVALFNMLPVPLFDGDRVLNDILELTLGEKKINYLGKSYLIRKIIHNIMRLFALSIVFGNLGLTLIRFGAFPIF